MKSPGSRYRLEQAVNVSVWVRLAAAMFTALVWFSLPGNPFLFVSAGITVLTTAAPKKKLGFFFADINRESRPAGTIARLFDANKRV